MKRHAAVERRLRIATAAIHLAVVAASFADATSLALIPARGDRQPAPAVIESLEAAWLQQKDVSLVERQQLEKILAEHQLSGAKLIDAKSRVRLGQLVPADLLVFVDGVPNLPRPATRIQVSESKSGIVLASQILENEPLLQNPQTAIELVQAAIAKRSVPNEERHILGYLDFRGEESGLLLDGTAAALGTLVITDLARSPNIVVLEREHLQHLQTERELTKLEQDLRASVRPLEGGIRRATETNRLEVTVVLRPLAAGDPITASVRVPAADTLSARTLIAERIAALLQTKRAEAPSVPRTLEAEVFARQASLWSAWGDPDRAAHAAETAYALEPSQTNRLLLANILNHTNSSLRAAARANQVFFDYCRLQGDMISSGGETNRFLPSWKYRPTAPALGDNGEAPELRKEIDRLEEDVFRCQLDHYRKHYEATGGAYWSVWQNRLDHLHQYYEGDARRQVALIRESLDAFLNPPVSSESVSSARLAVPAQLPMLVVQSEGSRKEAYCPLLKELTVHRDPAIRLFAFAALKQLLYYWGDKPGSKEEIREAHEAILKIYVDEIPPHHPYRALEGNERKSADKDQMFLLYCGTVYLASEKGSGPDDRIQKELDYYVKILKAAIASGEPERLGALNRSSMRDALWLDLLDKYGRTAEALELTKAMIEWSKDYKPMGRSISDSTVNDLTQRRDRYERILRGDVQSAAPVTKLSPNDPGWEGFELRPVNLGWKLVTDLGGYNRGNLWMLADGNRLYCLRAMLQDWRVNLDLTIHWLPTGAMIGHIEVPCQLPPAEESTSSGRWINTVCSAALSPDVLYVGTHSGLLRVSLRTKDWKLIRPEDGLPGGIVRALGWYDGRLYLAFGIDPMYGRGGGQAIFAAYDPKQSQFEILASEKGVDTQNPWNGVRFQVDDIVGDPAHACLWLKDRMRGLWKFDPVKRAFEQILSSNPPVILSGSRYVGNFELIVGTGASSPVNLFRPRDKSHQEVPRIVGPHWFNTISFNAASEDDIIVASAKSYAINHKLVTFLMRPGQPPAILSQTAEGKPFPGAAYLQETGAGILAVAQDGEAFLIRRKEKEAAYRQVELQAASGEEQETKLMSAAEAGQLPEIEALLAKGVNIHAVDHHGWTPLHYAIERKHPDAALLLLRKGADAGKLTESGRSPLHFAAEADDVAVLKELLARHVAIEPLAFNGAPPLTLAAARGAMNTAKLLIAAGADVNHRNADGFQSTVLMSAALEGQLEMVNLLLDHHAKLEGTDQYGNTALMCAAVRGRPEVIQRLHDRGADLNAANREGWTALMLAILREQPEAVRALLEAGADPNKQRRGGFTALIDAAEKSPPEIVQSLIDHRANVNHQRDYGRSALIHAAEKDRLDVMKILLKAGADANAVAYRMPGYPLHPIDFAKSPEGRALLQQAAPTSTASEK